MSDRDQEQSVSQAVQELTAKVKTWDAKLAAWRGVIAEELTTVLEQSEAQAGARSRQIAQLLAQERETWRAEMQSLLSRLSASHAAGERLTDRQARLIQRYEAEIAPWRLGLSRATVRVVVVSVLLALLTSWGGVTVWEAVGPPARARAERAALLARHQGWWNAATDQQRAQIQQQWEEQLQKQRQAKAAGK